MKQESPTLVAGVSTTLNLMNGWQGSLDLVYIQQQETTKLSRALVKAPLKVQRPFYPEGQAICHSVILHTAGGIVGGDNLNQNIHLQENAQVLLTTAAAGKVYRSQEKMAQQNTTIQIDKGAYLEWLPQETIIFNGAIYQQNLRVELAPESNFLGWEITRFGRSAKGEKFIQGEWRSQTEIWQQGQPLWIDRQWLPASEKMINSPHSLAGKSVVGTLIWLGKPISLDIIEQARLLWQTNLYQGESGVTQTQGDGLLCRYRGFSTSEVRHWFTEVWQLLRQTVLQRSIIKPRVWL